MSDRKPAWHSLAPDDAAACVRCGEVKDLLELDRLLWCKECRFEAREHAAWWGWGIGLAFAACVALYIFVVIRPTDLVVAGWIGTVVAAVWIGGRLGRELVYGIMRFRQTEAPDGAPGASPPAGGNG